ncbi:hypothetical protein H2204_001555 [Knufia peltigerae]|uniref:3'(2'),5'-bisphosphate nucleotidase n=1 Tax=Knufia peltigerae TaxID=1002370 RepID=A0AA39D168_9EURO|nr:hypothetical protein H2204_001555 [Knufia peltigerae]
MKTPYLRERQVAEAAVLRASIMTKQVQSAVREISKEDASPVTVADFAAQALIIHALRDAFPEDSFLGEEDSSVLRNDESLRDEVYQLILSAPDVEDPVGQLSGRPLPKPSSVDEMLQCIDLGGRGQGGDTGRIWIMDPIDGTAAFLRGQQYGVSLALIEDGKEVVGVLGCPNICIDVNAVSEAEVDTNGLGLMLSAVRGQGSTVRAMASSGLGDAKTLDRRGEMMSSPMLHIVDCSASTDSRHDIVAKVASEFKTSLPSTEIWSLHVRYAALIVGDGDVHVCVPPNSSSRMHVWDHAGSQLIFTEVGGAVTDLDGNQIDFGAGRDLNRNRGMVVSRRGIHKAILAAIRRILLKDG